MLIAANFHYIRENYLTPYPAFFGTTPRKFREQLELLAAFGGFLGQDEIQSAIQDNAPIIGNKWVITFDDGLKEQIEFALPILNDMGIPAIFYVNTLPLVEKKILNVHKIHLVRSVISPMQLTKIIHAELGKLEIEINHTQISALGRLHYKYDDVATAEMKYLLNFTLPTPTLEYIIDNCFNDVFEEESLCNEFYVNENDIKNLSSKKLLGSHSHSHKPLGTLLVNEQVFEIGKSAEILKNITGCVPNSFSYPYGSKEAVFGLEEILKKESFSYAFTMDRGTNPDRITKPFLLSRFDNNDLPGGKSWKFGEEKPFNTLPISQYQI